MNATLQAFRKVLAAAPDLCAGGLAPAAVRSRLGADFDLERRRLEESFEEFSRCCEWLLDCTPLKHVSFVSPVSADLLSRIVSGTGASVSNGALIAAVLHMRIPHHPLPGSPNVRIGISLRSPALSGS